MKMLNQESCSRIDGALHHESTHIARKYCLPERGWTIRENFQYSDIPDRLYLYDHYP